LRRFVLLSILISALASPIRPNHLCQEKTVPFTKPAVAEIEVDLYELIKKEREKLNLLPLVFSSELRSLAREHSQDMASHDSLSHASSSGQSYTERLVQKRLFFMENGENVAFSETYTTEFIHHSFMESPEHRNNILHPNYDWVGVGVVFRKDKGYYITQDFMQSLKPRNSQEAKEEFQKSVALLRQENALPPLSYSEEADEYAQKHSTLKAQGKPLPPLPSYFGETHSFYITSPSLKEAPLIIIKGKILDKTYESAGLGISFCRTEKHPGGTYFITLLLFPERKYKHLNDKEINEIIFQTINEMREKRGLAPFILDKRLAIHAQRTAKKTSIHKTRSPALLPMLPATTFFSYITEDPNLIPEEVKEKIETNYLLYKKIGIGIHFGQHEKIHRGAFAVFIILER